MKWKIFALCLLLAALTAQGAGGMGGRAERAAPAAAQVVDKDVPYVPTPRAVVETMLRLAAPGPSDVHYDLGCGDGRIVVAALKEYGVKRGVGVDIDPERIKESRDNAAKAGVADKAEFLQQDLFQTDFSEADVLTLYLLPSVNLRLRPKILTELKPGSRVVSHSFDMGEWKPEKSVREGSASVHFWVVPANISGDWTWSGPSGERYGLRLEQRFQEATGTLVVDGSASKIREARIEGDRLRFMVERNQGGKTVPMRFEGRVTGNRLNGTVVAQDGAMDMAEWRAERDPSTMVALDGDASPPTRSGTATPSVAPTKSGKTI